MTSLSASRWSLNPNPFRALSRNKLKDQLMKKIRFSLLALASLSLVTAASASTITENFSTNPWQNGWNVFGDTNLFGWDSTNGNLQVTWDSRQTNSYFYQPLGTILTKDDDFSLDFDLQLNDVGPADSFEFSFQIAVGFLNVDQAVQPGFLRGTGYNATNLVELAYFREDSLGDPATIYPTFIGKDGQFNYNPGGSDSLNYALTLGDTYHFTMSYASSNQTLLTVLSNLTTTATATVTQALGSTFSATPFTDFQVNAISINNYNESGQYPGYEGSVLAHGTVDNFALMLPPPPVQNLTGALSNGLWSVNFVGRTNWLYSLERSTDLQVWATCSPNLAGLDGSLTLSDTNAVSENAFYRVRADRP